MCDSQYESDSNVDLESEKIFKCRECNEISTKELMCACNYDKAKEYMYDTPKSKLALNLVKCYKCSNCWHGYKRCDCDDLDDLDKTADTKEDNEEDNEEENNENFNHFVKCDNCGNIWDGCAQCNCWGLSFDSDSNNCDSDVNIVNTDNEFNDNTQDIEQHKYKKFKPN